jgi:hypothetical protein
MFTVGSDRIRIGAGIYLTLMCPPIALALCIFRVFQSIRLHLDSTTTKTVPRSAIDSFHHGNSTQKEAV